MVYGHCLAVSFVQLLSKHKPFIDEYEVVPYYSTAIIPPKEDNLQNCSLLIYQRAALSNPAIDKVNSNSTRISYPYSEMHCLWPWPQKAALGEYNYRTGSVLVDLVQNNHKSTDDEILEKYKNVNLTDYFNLEEIYQRDIKAFQHIDNFCDVKFLDISPSILKEQYFFTINHISIKQKISILNKVLEKLHFPPLTNEIIEEYSKPPQQMIPIHPRIVERLKLNWVDKNTKYWCFHKKATTPQEANYGTTEIFGWFTFDEYIKNYIKLIKETK